MAAPTSQPTAGVKLDPELREPLRRLAEVRRRTPHWLMREAIAQYVAREEVREQLRDDALAAWAEYDGDWAARDRGRRRCLAGAA